MFTRHFLQTFTEQHPDQLLAVLVSANAHSLLTWADWWWVSQRTQDRAVVQLFLNVFGTVDFPRDPDPGDQLRSVSFHLDWLIVPTHAPPTTYNPLFITTARHHAPTLNAHRSFAFPQLAPIDWIDCLSRAMLPPQSFGYLAWPVQCGWWSDHSWRNWRLVVCAVCALNNQPAVTLSPMVLCRVHVFAHLVATTAAQDAWLRLQWTLTPCEEDAVRVLRRHWTLDFSGTSSFSNKQCF